MSKLNDFKLTPERKRAIKELIVHKQPMKMSQQERRLNLIAGILLNTKMTAQEKQNRVRGIANYSRLLKKLGVD